MNFRIEIFPKLYKLFPLDIIREPDFNNDS